MLRRAVRGRTLRALVVRNEVREKVVERVNLVLRLLSEDLVEDLLDGRSIEGRLRALDRSNEGVELVGNGEGLVLETGGHALNGGTSSDVDVRRSE